MGLWDYRFHNRTQLQNPLRKQHTCSYQRGIIELCITQSAICISSLCFKFDQYVQVVIWYRLVSFSQWNSFFLGFHSSLCLRACLFSEIGAPLKCTHWCISQLQVSNIPSDGPLSYTPYGHVKEKVTSCRMGTKLRLKWNLSISSHSWSRCGLDSKSIWNTFDVEVNSKCNRSEIQLQSMWARSDIEVASKWHPSVIEVSSKDVGTKSNRSRINVMSKWHWSDIDEMMSLVIVWFNRILHRRFRKMHPATYIPSLQYKTSTTRGAYFCRSSTSP
jgi:hypothetical protein